MVVLLIGLICCINFYQLRHKFANLREVFANNLSANIKLSETQISKTIQSDGFFGTLLKPLTKVDLPLMNNVSQPLAKSVNAAVASAADARIHKSICWLRNYNTSNNKWRNKQYYKNIEIPWRFLFRSLLIKGVTKKTEN